MNSERTQEAEETRICLENYAGKLQNEMNLYLFLDMEVEELLAEKLLWVESVTVTGIEFPALRNSSIKEKMLSWLVRIRVYFTEH